MNATLVTLFFAASKPGTGRQGGRAWASVSRREFLPVDSSLNPSLPAEGHGRAWGDSPKAIQINLGRLGIVATDLDDCNTLLLFLLSRLAETNCHPCCGGLVKRWEVLL